MRRATEESAARVDLPRVSDAVSRRRSGDLNSQPGGCALADMSDARIVSLENEELVDVIKQAELPFLRPSDTERLPFLDRQMLERLVFLARRYRRNAV